LLSVSEDFSPAFEQFVSRLLEIADSIGQAQNNNSFDTLKVSIDDIGDYVYRLPDIKDIVVGGSIPIAVVLYQLASLQSGLQHDLKGLGLRVICPSNGEAFDSIRHQSDEENIHWFRKGYTHNTIAAVNAIGFSWNEDVLKRAQVEKYMRDPMAVVLEDDKDERSDSLSTDASRQENSLPSLEKEATLLPDVEPLATISDVEATHDKPAKLTDEAKKDRSNDEDYAINATGIGSIPSVRIETENTVSEIQHNVPRHDENHEEVLVSNTTPHLSEAANLPVENEASVSDHTDAPEPGRVDTVTARSAKKYTISDDTVDS
jgi:hypothetical protein